jgi:hypothetical protein
MNAYISTLYRKNMSNFALKNNEKFYSIDTTAYEKCAKQ